MKKPVYRLHVSPGDGDGEGENLDEWFASLKEAKERRHVLIRLNPGADDADLQIERVLLVHDSPYQLALKILNRRCYVRDRLEVVPVYQAPIQKQEEE